MRGWLGYYGIADIKKADGKVERMDTSKNKNIAGSGILQHTITNERLARRGYYDISEAYKSLHCL